MTSEARHDVQQGSCPLSIYGGTTDPKDLLESDQAPDVRDTCANR